MTGIPCAGCWRSAGPARWRARRGAARTLDVSHATIFRRLNAAERRLGQPLFVRERSGYVPTAAGERMMAEAAEMEGRIQTLERDVIEGDAAPAGPVRLTTTDTLFDGVLASILGALRQRHPAITLEVAISNETYSLSRRQADLAVRPMTNPPEALIAQRLGRIAMAPYVAAGEESRTSSTWLGLDDSVYFPALSAWMQSQGIDDSGWRIDTLLGLASAVRRGAGAALLPCYLADADPALVRIGEPVPELATDLWLLVHPDLRRVARVRAVRDAIGHAIEAETVQARLAGRAGQAF
ncbi:MAG: LysR family transcriptional regulator [Salinisphaera sp.]